MEICFEGIGQVVATFRTKDKTLTAGMAVTLTGNGKVGLGEEESDKPLCGVTVGAVRNGAVAVQIGGVVKVGYAGKETFNVGYVTLTCDGDGGVKTADGTDGARCLVLAVDKEEKTIAVKL